MTSRQQSVVNHWDMEVSHELWTTIGPLSSNSTLALLIECGQETKQVCPDHVRTHKSFKTLYRSTLYISLRDANKVGNSLFTHQPLAVECPILPTIWFDDEDVNKYQIILLKNNLQTVHKFILCFTGTTHGQKIGRICMQTSHTGFCLKSVMC